MTGPTVDLHSDQPGLWWVWCDVCDRQLGDPVPYEMAEAKRTAHDGQHIEVPS